MSFVSNIVGGILGASAAGKAANAGVQGAQAAQALEKQNQDAAVTAQQTALGNVTAAETPYQTVGSTGANALNKYISQGFTAPDPNAVASTPEYQFALKQGTAAIDQNAAANGTLFTGNTGTALENYGQGLASQQYQQAYNNALNTYQTNLNAASQGTNYGLTSTGQLEGANLTTAGNTANIDMTAAQQQAQQINNAAAARASGYLGKAAGYGQAIGGVVSAIPSVMEGLQGGGGFGDVMSSLEGMG